MTESNEKTNLNPDTDFSNEPHNLEGHQIDFYYLIGVLYRYWKFITVFTISIAILSVIYVLVATPIYLSTVSLYPMNKDEGGPLKQLALTLGMSNKTTGFYILDVLNSRRISKKVIYNKYTLGDMNYPVDLIEFWEMDKLGISENRVFELAFRTLKASVELKEDKETSLVTIAVSTKNKYLSKQIADKYCEEVINYLNFELKNSIKESIKFSEIRLDSVRIKLLKAEENLVDFQNSNTRATSPSMAMETKRKYADVELMQDVVVLLEKQIELLKIEEVKDKTVINILDTPDYYDKPVKPQKRRVVYVNTFIAFLAAYVGVILFEKAVKYKVAEKLLSELKKPKK